MPYLTHTCSPGPGPAASKYTGLLSQPSLLLLGPVGHPDLTGGMSTSSSVWRPQESVMAPVVRGFCAAQGTQPMQLPT